MNAQDDQNTIPDHSPERRALAREAAWGTQAVLVSAPAPAFAASPSVLRSISEIPAQR